MTKTKTTLILGGILAALCLMSSATLASALTGNVGLASENFFRGADAGTGATASAGVDYDFGNKLTIGAWGADVGDGLEVDLYGAYSDKINQFDYSVGFTTYQFTGEFDNASEINLNVSTGPISLEYSIGSISSSPSADYTFLALTYTQGNAYGTYGLFGSDIDGSYIEVGYGLKINDVDASIAIISADKDLSIIDADGDGNTEADMSLVLSLSKSFDIK